ncbi:protein of unknown function [Lentzea waywayandensis]|uniref:DUF397 domain-containing protein n=1 Tax=Lentzea waywayandensis TaxID=84724 RepID=A0A1I6FEA5_9PSEU|nr:DUF397 domain-containing protein [Lentzea waywayandensis]SFR28238.1 protein of unknown function [Lentzea waywayandensis]
MAEWRKSTFSANASDCLEVAWRKSSYSANASECVEVAIGIGIRDSKAPAAHIEINADAWTAFLAGVTRER